MKYALRALLDAPQFTIVAVAIVAIGVGANTAVFNPIGGTDVETETRVYGTDPGATRRFAAYWRIIYPGSALIRVMWLRAIRQRAGAG